MQDSNIINILSMCYDSVKWIKNGAYLVESSGNRKIVDKDNNTLLDIGTGKAISTGYRLFICLDYYFEEYSLDNFIKIKDTKYTSIKRFSDNAYIIETDGYESKGIINCYGDVILPPMYRTLKLSHKTSTHDIIWANPSPYKINIRGRNRAFTKDDIDTISIRNDYMKADEFLSFRTSNPDVNIVAVSYREVGNKYDTGYFNLKYRAKVNGRLIGKEYDDIMYSEFLIGRDIMQVYSYNNILDNKWSLKTGIQRLTGEEVIEPLLNDIKHVGNDIFITKSDKYGINVGSKTMYTTSTFDDYSVCSNIPIIIMIKDGNQFILGTDGFVHNRVEEAFNIYRANENEEVYMIMLYNGLVITDKNLNRLTNLGSIEEVKNRYTWRKLQ